MANKFQYGSVGGIRKVQKTAAGSSTATTIAGLEGKTLTLAQLQALLQAPSTLPPANPGTPTAGSLNVTYPLQGGGVLGGNVSLRIAMPPIPVLFTDALEQPMMFPPGTIGPQTSGGGGSAWSISDGTHTVAGVTSLVITGATVGGTSPNATLAITGSGGSSPFNVTPDTHGTIPTGVGVGPNDEFEGSSLDTAGTRYSGATAWTWVNQNSATAALAQGAVEFSASPNGSTDVNFFVQVLPSGNCSYVCKYIALCENSGNFSGLLLYESGTGKLLEFGIFNNGGVLDLITANGTISGLSIVTSANITPVFLLGAAHESLPLYLEVVIAGSNLTFSFSLSGLPGTFIGFATYALTSYFTTAPDRIGLGGESQGSGLGVGLFDWFRRTT